MSGLLTSVEMALAQGRDLWRAGRVGEAESAFRTVLAFQPDHPEAMWSIGVLVRERGDLTAAIDSLSRASRLAPRETAVWFDLALTQLRAGQPGAARESAARALKLQPDAVEVHALVAEVEITAGNGRAALASAQRVLKQQPSSGLLARRPVRSATPKRPFGVRSPLSPMTSMPRSISQTRCAIRDGRATPRRFMKPP